MKRFFVRITFKQYINNKWVSLSTIDEIRENSDIKQIYNTTHSQIDVYLTEIMNNRIFIINSDNSYTSVNPEFGPIKIYFKIEYIGGNK